MAFQSHPSTPPTPPSQSSSAGAAHLPTPWRRSWRSLLSPNTSSNPLPPRSALLAWATAPLTALLLFAPTPPAWAERCRGLDEISSRCTELWLYDNNLSSLPEGIFRGLNNLEQLWLWGNNLSSLPAGIFRGLNNLEVLDLAYNHLSSLPEGIFRGLNNLEQLWLWGNNLSSLPAGIFRGLNNLEVLDLDDNNLRSLPAGIFRGLNNLEKLWLEKNNLRSLPAGIFRGLNNLALLDLEENNLSCLPELPSSLVFLYVDGDSDNDINDHGLPLCSGEPEEPMEEEEEEESCEEDPDRNCPPEAVGAIGGQSIMHGVSTLCTTLSGQRQTSVTVPVGGFFTDGDGDLLSYGVVSSDPAVARGSLSGSSLTVEGLRQGEVSMTVTADDGNGDGTASQSFSVTVMGNNPAPVVAPELIFLDESPEDHAATDLLTGGRASYGVHLSCPPTVEVTVEIANTSGGVLSLSTTSLTFSPSNWNTPQPVEVETVGRVRSGDITSTQFPVPHLAIAVNEQGETVRTRSSPDLLVQIIPADTSLLNELFKDVVEATTEAILGKAQEKATKGVLEHSGKKVGKPIVKGILKKAASRLGIVGNVTSVLDIINIFSERLGTSLPVEEQVTTLTATLFRQHEALHNGSLSWERALLPSQGFALPLSLSQGGADSRDGEGASSFNALLRGNIEFSRFEESGDDFDVDGSATAYVLGLDLLPHADVPLVTGLQLAFTRAHSEFEDEEIASSGDHDLRLFSVHPSVAWDATEHLTLWASLGYGRGETELTIDAIEDERFDFVEGSSSSSSGDFFSAAAGATMQVWESGVSALDLKVDGATTTFLETEVQQGRLAAQLSHDFTLSRSRLRSSAELALLLSGEDASATELSGTLNWLPHQGRLSGSSKARVLLFGEDRSEWGIGGGLTLLPGQQGEGFSLSVQPSLGQSGANRLQRFEAGAFAYDPAELELGTSPLTARFEAEVAYGFRHHHGLLTPYSQLDLSATSTVYGAGLRYELDTSLDLDLNASRRSRASGTNENRVFLQLRSDL